MRNHMTITAALALSACNSHGGDSPVPANDDAEIVATASASNDVTPPVTTASQSPDANKGPLPTSSLSEPTGPIDPKSSEAAGQVVQHYGALIEQRKFADAAAYWNNAASAAAFATKLKAYREVRLTIGNLGEQEGAAGSIYITEPVTFYGKTTAGKDFSRKAVVTLRRVNDVPGSTAAQRKWHIQSIDWS
jgi:hypothetical protein